jgi:hypothetical protein
MVMLCIMIKYNALNAFNCRVLSSALVSVN